MVTIQLSCRLGRSRLADQQYSRDLGLPSRRFESVAGFASMIRHISDRIQVMYLGRVVEAGPFDRVLDAPLHPYTRALAQGVPVADPEADALRRGGAFDRSATELAEPAAGCPYHPRCPLVEPVGRAVPPHLLTLAPDHAVACHVAARDAEAPRTP